MVGRRELGRSRDLRPTSLSGHQPLPPDAREPASPVGPCSASRWMDHGHEGISSAGGGEGWLAVTFTGGFGSVTCTGGFNRRFQLAVSKTSKTWKIQHEPSRLSERRAISWCCKSRTSTPRNRRWSHASVSSARRKPPCQCGRGRHPCTRCREGTRRPRGWNESLASSREEAIAASASLPSRRRCRSRCSGSCLGHASRHATRAGIAYFGRRRWSCLV